VGKKEKVRNKREIKRLHWRENFLIKILVPKLILFNNIKEEYSLECGFYLSNLDTGVYYCRYDFGCEIKIALFGFGLYIWWLPNNK